MEKIVRGFEEEKLKDCKEDIDTLLVFVCDQESLVLPEYTR